VSPPISKSLWVQNYNIVNKSMSPPTNKLLRRFRGEFKFSSRIPSICKEIFIKNYIFHYIWTNNSVAIYVYIMWYLQLWFLKFSFFLSLEQWIQIPVIHLFSISSWLISAKRVRDYLTFLFSLLAVSQISSLSDFQCLLHYSKEEKGVKIFREEEG